MQDASKQVVNCKYLHFYRLCGAAAYKKTLRGRFTGAGLHLLVINVQYTVILLAVDDTANLFNLVNTEYLSESNLHMLGHRYCLFKCTKVSSSTTARLTLVLLVPRHLGPHTSISG